MKNINHSHRILETFKDWSDYERQTVEDGFALMDLHRQIDMFSEIWGSRFNVSVKQIEILEILYSHPEMRLTPADLADMVHLTRSTMTGNLDTLQEKKFISRESHPKDRRMTVIRLTEEGIEFCKKIMPKRYSDILRVMKMFTPEEKIHLKKIYKKLLNLMREIATEATN